MPRAGEQGYLGTYYSEQQILNFLYSFLTMNAGAKALIDAAAGVALEANTPCKYVDITCAGGLMAIGNSTSVRADGSAFGLILTPGSTYYRVFCSNLNQVYVSGATGTRACYVYYT